jgi:hypothetical protein
MVFLQTIKLSHQLQMTCDYHKDYESNYHCKVKDFRTTYDDRNVTSVVGMHLLGFKDKDVTYLNIRMQDCPFLPLNLNKIFPNLKKLSVSKSNVQHLMTGDLDGLEKLEYLDLSNNPIEQIGHDFFRFMSKLKTIDFDDCHLKKIDAEAFDPIDNLDQASFLSNECIDQLFNKFDRHLVSTTRKLKTTVINNCQGTHHKLKPHFRKNCQRKVKAAESTFLDTFVIAALVLLAIITLTLAASLVYTYQITFHGNWSQMKRFLK